MLRLRDGLLLFVGLVALVGALLLCSAVSVGAIHTRQLWYWYYTRVCVARYRAWRALPLALRAPRPMAICRSASPVVRAIGMALLEMRWSVAEGLRWLRDLGPQSTHGRRVTLAVLRASDQLREERIHWRRERAVACDDGAEYQHSHFWHERGPLA